MQTQSAQDAVPAKDSNQRILDLTALQAAQFTVLNILQEIERERSYLPPLHSAKPDSHLAQKTARGINKRTRSGAIKLPDILDNFGSSAR